MRKIREVLRYRHSAGLSLEATARALNISKGVVAKYIRLAGAAGLSWPLPDELDDVRLEKLLYRQVRANPILRVCLDWPNTTGSRRTNWMRRRSSPTSCI